jgi:tripartite-type tricarboxylate transporter receptor subunit TctC
VRITLRTAAAALIAFLPVHGAGQSYPAKSIRMVVPLPPGGATDLLGRLVAQKLAERTGQTVVTENRTGAGGMVGAEFIARSQPDGYTIGIAGVPHAINMTLYRTVNFSLANDMTAIVQLATFPSMIAVHPSMPVKTMPELLAVARSAPGGLSFGASPGSPNHLAMELINVRAGVKMVHIGYKGAGPVIIDLIGGHLHVSSLGFPGAMPHVKTGRLRPIAVTSAKRAALLPELPTVAEAALPGFDVTSWYGVFGPARIPPDVVAKLNSEIRAIMQDADVRARLGAVGAEIETNSTQEFTQLVRAEIDRWAKVVRASGASVN